jgi:hypothetical protein
MSRHCVLDGLGQVKVRGGHSKLPDRRATESPEVQTTNGETVQNWFVTYLSGCASASDNDVQ